MCTRSAQAPCSSRPVSSEARPSTVSISGYISGYVCRGGALRPRPGAPRPPPALQGSPRPPGVRGSPNLQREDGEQLSEPVLDDEELQEPGQVLVALLPERAPVSVMEAAEVGLGPHAPHVALAGAPLGPELEALRGRGRSCRTRRASGAPVPRGPGRRPPEPPAPGTPAARGRAAPGGSETLRPSPGPAPRPRPRPPPRPATGSASAATGHGAARAAAATGRPGSRRAAKGGAQVAAGEPRGLGPSRSPPPTPGSPLAWGAGWLASCVQAPLPPTSQGCHIRCSTAELGIQPGKWMGRCKHWGRSAGGLTPNPPPSPAEPLAPARPCRWSPAARLGSTRHSARGGEPSGTRGAVSERGGHRGHPTCFPHDLAPSPGAQVSTGGWEPEGAAWA